MSCSWSMELMVGSGRKKKIIPGIVIEKPLWNPGQGKASKSSPSLIPQERVARQLGPGFRVRYPVCPGPWEQSGDVAMPGTPLCSQGAGPCSTPSPALVPTNRPSQPPGGSHSSLNPHPTLARPARVEVDGSPRCEEAVTCCHCAPEQQNH